GHDRVGRAYKLATNEYRRDGRVTTELNEGPLHLFPTWVLVELVDSRTHALLVEEALDGMTHVASALAEYHHCLLGRQPRHLIHDWVSFFLCNLEEQRRVF
ncbi:hypothetical protein LINGRAHAP2_LOCUS6359, partial [Linum grandiflorum]